MTVFSPLVIFDILCIHFLMLVPRCHLCHFPNLKRKLSTFHCVFFMMFAEDFHKCPLIMKTFPSMAHLLRFF